MMLSNSIFCILFASIIGVFAQLTADCNGLAYQAATNPSEQLGYNACNSTTENQSSLCQTVFINSIDDFCIWGPANPVTDMPLNENEIQQVVAWCTRPGHGARIIPPNTLSYIIFNKTPDYVEVLAWFDQSMINYPSVRSIQSYPGNQWPAVNITAQLDPQGTDGKGGPIGGLVFSNVFGNTNAKNWVSIVGPGGFMIRACDPTVSGSDAYCSRWPGNTYWSWLVFFDTVPYPGHSTGLPPSYQDCTGESIQIGAYTGADQTTKVYTGGNPPGMVPVAIHTNGCATYSSQQVLPTAFTKTTTQVCKATAQASLGQASHSLSSNSLSSPSSTSLSQSQGQGQSSLFGSGFGSGSGPDSPSSPSSFSLSPLSPSISSHILQNIPSGARTAAIAGIIIGVLAVLALIAFLCIRRRRRNRQGILSNGAIRISSKPFTAERSASRQSSLGEIHKSPIPTTTETSLLPTDISGTGPSPLISTSTSSQVGIQSDRKSSAFVSGTSAIRDSTVISGFPPAYSEVSGPPPSVGPGSELALWAQDNRDVISHDLEVRLREAHYLPPDNPDEIAQDVWAREYGIRHFELKRLRQLYAQHEEEATSVV